MVSLMEALLARVKDTPEIRVAALFGSQARRLLAREDAADHYSDIDLQLVTSESALFESESWFHTIPGHRVVFCAKRSVFGGVSKYTVLFEEAELDCVVVPYARLNVARLAYRGGLHRVFRGLRRGLMNFTDLMRFAHVVVKGGPRWEAFYRDASAELPRIGLSNEEVLRVAGVAYVDAVAVLGRIARGELLAARRLFFQSVIEANLQLVHESRERRGKKAYHRARRAEAVLDPEELSAIALESSLEPATLRASTVSAIEHCGRLVESLIGRRPDWPALETFENKNTRGR